MGASQRAQGCTAALLSTQDTGQHARPRVTSQELFPAGLYSASLWTSSHHPGNGGEGPGDLHCPFCSHPNVHSIVSSRELGPGPSRTVGLGWAGLSWGSKAGGPALCWS